jgi:hypothetical protein
MFEIMCRLRDTIHESSTSELSKLRIDKSHWSIRIHSKGSIGWYALQEMLEPIMSTSVLKSIRKRHLKVTLDGNLPRQWMDVFDRMMRTGAGFDSSEVVEVDEPHMDVDQEMLDDYFWYRMRGGD